MKLTSQILGSVTPETVSKCAGNLLFISNRQIILSAGDDGRHISLHESKIQFFVENFLSGYHIDEIGLNLGLGNPKIKN